MSFRGRLTDLIQRRLTGQGAPASEVESVHVRRVNVAFDNGDRSPTGTAVPPTWRFVVVFDTATRRGLTFTSTDASAVLTLVLSGVLDDSDVQRAVSTESPEPTGVILGVAR